MTRFLLVLCALALGGGWCAGCACERPAEDRADATPRETSMTTQVTIRGNPATVEGRPPAVGEPAPDFVAVNNDMNDVRLSDFRGQTVILVTTPSLETSVCDTQTRTFNERAADLENTVILTLSMDLPFAQKRWCGNAGVEDVITLSDYKYREVAEKYGIRIREHGLLGRAVWVIGPDGVIQHREIVAEQTDEPDYEAALAAAR